MEKEYTPIKIITDDDTNHEGELFNYQFIVSKDEEGNINTTEYTFVSNEYRDDKEVQKKVNECIKDAGIEEAAKRVFVTFGIDTNVSKKKVNVAVEALTKVIDDTKCLIDALTENE